jgi:hypothetical protein
LKKAVLILDSVTSAAVPTASVTSTTPADVTTAAATKMSSSSAKMPTSTE